MIPPSAYLMNSTVVVHVGIPTTSVQGGAGLSFGDAGTPYQAYVEAVKRAPQRTDKNGAPLSNKQYDVYTYTDTQAVTDSQLDWNGRTLSSLGRAQDLSGVGVLWLTECQEIT